MKIQNHIFGKNEMNGPTVKCTMNHNKPGVKKNSTVGNKEVINF